MALTVPSSCSIPWDRSMCGVRSIQFTLNKE
jgi:hypothetical protein